MKGHDAISSILVSRHSGRTGSNLDRGADALAFLHSLAGYTGPAGEARIFASPPLASRITQAISTEMRDQDNSFAPCLNDDQQQRCDFQIRVANSGEKSNIINAISKTLARQTTVDAAKLVADAAKQAREQECGK